MSEKNESASLNINMRDQKILEGLSQFSQKVPEQNNATETYTNQVVTKDLSIIFLLLPEWAPNYVPYNLARLSSITKNAGYRTHVFDINVAGYNVSRNWQGLEFDPWDPNYMPKWFAEEYFTYIHEKLQPLLEEYIERVVALNPSVVGFTLYDCNKEPVIWVNQELRKRLPNLITVLGGPICHRSDQRMRDSYFDYVVQGEGEGLILKLLQDIETNGKPATTKFFTQELSERPSLDNLPLPDWSHFTFNNYISPNGATLEFSRGCIAKCVFCDETHFWKYRDRDADRVMKEISELYSKGVNTIWFLDSLVNGNLKELRKFCQEVIKRKMDIHWSGYARCDERMDLDYFKDLKDAGCWGLSYGVESGSDKVLKDMNKAVTSEEIVKNFKDGWSVGLTSGCMIILGFPTEKHIDFYKTMEMLWRIRNYDITYVGGGFTCQIMPETILGQDRNRYDVLPAIFENNWITSNFDNSKIHRMFRLKTFNIFLDNLDNILNRNYCNRTNIRNHYTLKFENPNLQNEITVEDFDFNICKLNTGNNMADTLINEIWPLLRILYRGKGAFELDLNFDPEVDYREFGPGLATDFSGNFKFKIDSNGNWDADFKCKFNQQENAWHISDFSHGDSNALKRIRKFVENSQKKFPIEKHEIYTQDRNPIEVFYEKYPKINLSFDINWKGSGTW